jgi:sugar fermentation stimulation protein A
MNRKANSGSYIIVYRLDTAQEIQIGKLGRYRFEEGFYLYTGSGLTNLRQRIARHLRKRKTLKWHIDYLSVKCEPVWHSHREDGVNHECEWSSYLSRLEGFSQPVKGFGSSDCKCYSHLSFTKERQDWGRLIILP